MSDSVRLDSLKVDAVALADCMDCKWTYQYSGELQDAGAATLNAARGHAGRYGHRVLAHRTTEYDGRKS